MMVSSDLLCELNATLSVEAWTMMRRAWRTRHSGRHTDTRTHTHSLILANTLHSLISPN